VPKSDAMRVRVLAMAVGGVCLLGAAQCGGRTTLAPKVIAEGEFVARYAEATCGLREDCCREAGYSSALPGCQQGMVEDLDKMIRDALDAGAVYDPTAAGECVGAIAPTCDESESAKARRPSSCGRVYHGGKRPLGGPCLSDGACAATDGHEATCDRFVTPDGTVPQACRELLRVAREGEACVNPSLLVVVGCEEGTICDGGRCVAASTPKLGDACIDNIGDPCAEGTVCDRLGTKRCIVPLRGAGEPCTSPEQCELYRCDNGRCLGTRSVAAASVCKP
jgi:hypothetical protein